MNPKADERIDEVNDRLRLIQRLDGLTFGTDALLLAGYVDGRYKTGIELGSGTGIITMLLLTREKLGKAVCLEVQSEYADLTERNAELNGLSDRMRAVCADVRDYKPEVECEVVFSNPPYMRTDTGTRNENDGKYVARHEVCGNIGDFCSAAKRLLKHGGRFYVVYRPDRLCDLICAMRDNKLEPKRMTMVYNDPSYPPCLVLIEGRKGGGEGLFVTKPLFIKDKDEDSEEIRYIYENGEFSDGYRKE